MFHTMTTAPEELFGSCDACLGDAGVKPGGRGEVRGVREKVPSTVMNPELIREVLQPIRELLLTSCSFVWRNLLNSQEGNPAQSNHASLSLVQMNHFLSVPPPSALVSVAAERLLSLSSSKPSRKEESL